MALLFWFSLWHNIEDTPKPINQKTPRFAAADKFFLRSESLKRAEFCAQLFGATT